MSSEFELELIESITTCATNISALTEAHTSHSECLDDLMAGMKILAQRQDALERHVRFIGPDLR